MYIVVVGGKYFGVCFCDIISFNKYIVYYIRISIITNYYDMKCAKHLGLLFRKNKCVFFNKSNNTSICMKLPIPVIYTLKLVKIKDIWF